MQSMFADQRGGHRSKALCPPKKTITKGKFEHLLTANLEDEENKRKTADFMGSDKRQKFLTDVRDKMNEFLIKKDEDPVIFNAVLKTFVINQH